MTEKNIAIFASGAGSNALNLITYFSKSKAKIKLVVSTTKNAGVNEIAINHGIDLKIIDKKDLKSTSFIEELKAKSIDLIVLAGFLWLVPSDLIKSFNNRIVNIHPSLLPKYGGKGMYGKFVHEAVSEAGDRKTGITIHFVDEHFDSGKIIAQYETRIDANEEPSRIEEKVKSLEKEYLPKVVESVLTTLA